MCRCAVALHSTLSSDAWRTRRTACGFFLGRCLRPRRKGRGYRRSPHPNIGRTAKARSGRTNQNDPTCLEQSLESFFRLVWRSSKTTEDRDAATHIELSTSHRTIFLGKAPGRRSPSTFCLTLCQQRDSWAV